MDTIIEKAKKAVRYIDSNVLKYMKDIMDINLTTIEKKSINELYPIINGVYVLYSDGDVVYIGKSKNVFMRIIAHINDKGKNFDQYQIIECKEDELDIYKRILINTYLPRYNKDLTTKKYKQNNYEKYKS